MRFVCMDCALENFTRYGKSYEVMGFLRAVWHKLRGHDVVRLKNYDLDAWKVITANRKSFQNREKSTDYEKGVKD